VTAASTGEARAGWTRENGEPFRLVWALVEREIRDTLRDWRMVIPILILTLLFPLLMSFVADMAMGWVAKYGAPIVGDRLMPFLLMVVGFFPISFSLVIALETFVGEKERNSLEPLLATPLSDTQLYLGKTLAAMIPPLLAAYLGITVYLIGLYVFEGWLPSAPLLLLILLLTTAEGLVMVSGAVVVSSQTTSVRAANLLASFIIIPVAFLMQAEALIMFWANYHVLWWILAFLIVVDAILIRMGIHIFNREFLLGREIDRLNVPYIWRTFWARMTWEAWAFGLDVDRLPRWLRWLGVVGGFYRHRLPTIVHRSWVAIATVVLGLVLSAVVGLVFARWYPLPPEFLQLDQVSTDMFTELPAIDWLPSFTVWGVLANNIRALVGATLLAVFSFGALAITLLMAPLAIIFYFVVQAANAGFNPALFFGAFVMPHGILELPAAIMATALAVRMGAVFMSPPEGMTVGQGFLRALADFLIVFVALVVPLLALAAVLEVHVTPAVVVWAFGR
jgi:ABC-type transport system involved in multi-copper enzyme maturation permease subunit/uncharacterized membrane protein SpoIIM required for sporulation